MLNHKKNILVFILLSFLAAPLVGTTQHLPAKVRTVVTTDGEVDDVDTFIRLLLYSNEFKIAGLVYSSSQWHYKGDGKGTTFTSEIESTAKRYGARTSLRWPGTTWMESYIDKYAQSFPSLNKNAKNYPTPAYLKSIIRIGNIDFEGEMEYNTPGSDLIKKLLLDDQPGVLYLQIWGGTNTVARALKSIEETYKGTSKWKTIYKKISAKAVIYAVLDQDATYKKYIAPNWPEIRVIYNADQFWSFAYAWPYVVPAELQPYLSGDWFSKNIHFNHGPLLEDYYLWGDGKQIVGDAEHTHGSIEETKKNARTQYDFISEGDSPAFLFLVDVGLRNKEDASFGGWGGRMVKAERNAYRWEDGKNATDFNPFSKKMDAAYAQTRWIDVIQNDFASRADWCVKTYKEANHPPSVRLLGGNNLFALPGKTIKLAGIATDPDGNALSYHWWQYQEAGTFKNKIDIISPDQKNATFEVPRDAKKGETIHVVLEVKDAGVPNLTRYQRVIITVK